MQAVELLKLVGAALDRLGVPRFTTGSVASTMYGEPRFTNGVDIVVRMDAAQATAFCRQFGDADWYVSEDAALDAVRRRGQFNLIHVPSGYKVDLMVASDDDFNRSRFERVRAVTMHDGSSEPFAAPEDVILKKLEYFREGGSEKHLRDIRSIIAVQGADRIDWDYLESWARRLGVEAELGGVRPRQ